MTDDYLAGRGHPWDYDPGPPANRRWPRLFAEAPNYRALGKAVLGREGFRWHFGPMFYRGRLTDGDVRVLVIGQEGAQDESLAHRSFIGGTGARMQHFLNHIGITESYLFLNTFVYPIFGQYGSDGLRWLAQSVESPIARHRGAIFDYLLERNDVRLVVAVGTAAKESVATWVRSRGGACSGISDITTCDGTVLGPKTRLLGVRHPGGAGKGGEVSKIIADFKKAIRRVEAWSEDDPDWLPVDPGAARLPADTYKYKSAPIPFRDLPLGISWRLGRGGTSSNRKDNQRAIQIFSDAGKYNATVPYPGSVAGSEEGYAQDTPDLPYEPPKKRYRDYDRGPGKSFARLFMGGETGLRWPDFAALGVKSHVSFGCGPLFRGRPTQARVLVLADQESNDDLLMARALTGEGGQHLQEYLRSFGITKSYLMLRVPPVDTSDLEASRIDAIVDHPQVRALYAAIARRVLERSRSPFALVVGPHARRLAGHVLPTALPNVRIKAWHQSGALADWRNALDEIRAISFRKDVSSPSFEYDGARGQIPRFDLPFGTLRWQGSSGDRTQRARVGGKPSPDYYKLSLPQWVFELHPAPLSDEEQDAVEGAPG